MELKDNNNSVLLKKVFDAGANTIWSEMRKLRGQPEELKGNIRRRWIWELIQNASDCTKNGGKINIEVLIENNLLKFKHDGLPFVYENLVDLITQISSKQRSEDKKTGKFGTGFISTHLLSEKVGIKGILKEDDDYKELKFILDRSGTSYEEIRNQIESNLNDIEKLKSDDSKIIDEPNKNETVFVYKIAELEDTTSAVRIGLDDLKNTIAYVLALNESIQSITSENITYEVFDINHDQEIGCKIVTVKDSNEITYDVLVKQGKKTSIAIGVISNKDSTYKVLPLDKNIPKLFCKFPLIGTENFSFPVIINSSEFDIEKDRNAIHEGNEENIQIIDEAIELYRIVIEEACKSKWLDLYNLCNLNKNTDSSLQKKNNEVVRDIYENLDIVDTNLNGKYAGKYHIKEFDYIKNEEVPQIVIPYTKIEYREEFWELINDLGCYRIPIKESYIQWHTIFQENLSVESINNFLNSFGKLCEFEKYYCSKKYDVFEWLSRYYTIWCFLQYKNAQKCSRFM